MTRSSKKNSVVSLEELKVPNMGESVSQAVVGRFLVSSGDLVKAGQEVIELETDKLNQILSSPSNGVINWQVEPSQTVLIGQTLACIDSSSQPPVIESEKVDLVDTESIDRQISPVDENLKNTFVSQELPGLAAVLNPPLPPSQKKTGATRISREQTLMEGEVFHSPFKEGGVLENSSTSLIVHPAEETLARFKETRQRLPQMRKTIAQRLLKAQQESAMLTTFNEIDMSSIIQIRERFGEKFFQKHGVKLGFMSFFVKATVAALKKEPSLNARIEGEEWVQRLDYHLGVAVSTEKGLVVPVIRNCDALSLADIEKQISEVALRAREGKIKLEELQGGSFTITNGGVFGSLLSTPILNPPQSGILGMHKIQKRPIVNERDEIVARPMMYTALTYDHRVVDGRQAVGFLVALKEAIEQPEKLWLDI